MEKHVVLVVHGIGEQAAGETVDQVVAGAQAEHARNHKGAKLETHTDLVHLTEETFEDLKAARDDLAKAENGRNVEDNTEKHPQPHLFPAHIRRLVSKDAKGKPKKETVFAEVFWADKSPAPKGAFGTVFDLIKILLAIAYLAIDNAANVRSKAALRWVDLFVIFFFGGVLAINAVLFCGTVVLAIEQQTVDLAAIAQSGAKLWGGSAEVVVLLVAALSMGMFAWVKSTRKDYYIWMVFAKGMRFWAALSVVFVVLSLFQVLTPNQVNGDPLDYEILQLHLFIKFAFLAMTLSWIPGIIACVMTYVVWSKERKQSLNDGVTGQRRIYGPVCSAVVLLWMVMSASFWLGIQSVANRISISGIDHAEHIHKGRGVLLETLNVLGDALRTPLYGAACFLVLLGYVGILMYRRGKRGTELYTGKNQYVDRLLLNPGLQWVFALSSLLIGIMIVLATYGHLTDEAGLLGVRLVEVVPVSVENQAESGDWLGAASGVLTAFLLLLAGVVYNSPQVVGGGLGAVRDIVVYASCVKPELADPDKDNPDNFVDRKSIEGRFNSVLKYMLRNETPDKLTVIAHSQGTVVSTRCLKNWIGTDPNLDKNTTLITMGSPVTHLYRQYFPTAFDVPKATFNKIEWYGFFRTDDFVGTTIDGVLKTDDCNFKVGPGGHPGYFTDPLVWQRICEPKIGFDMS